MTLIDTAHAYTTVDEEAHDERVVARAVRTHPRGGDVLVATKGGHFRAGPSGFPVDGRPDTIRAHCETSLRTLGVEAIGLRPAAGTRPSLARRASRGCST